MVLLPPLPWVRLAHLPIFRCETLRNLFVLGPIVTNLGLGITFAGLAAKDPRL